MTILKGRVALVTGAGRGIGAATSARLAGEGATVFVSDMEFARAEAVVAEIRKAGGVAHPVRLDVTDEAGWRGAIDAIAKTEGLLDILVNNAGITIAKYVEETTLADWRLMMSVNVEGQFLGVKAALPLMKESAKRTPFGGSIVNMSSVSGIVGTPVLAAYTATKAGVRYFSKSIAIDFGRRGYRIRVNSVHPGATEGESAQLLFEARVRAGQSPSIEQARQDWLVNYPLGRMGRTADIADGVLFLASDQSAFVTGTELVIDGGLSAQ
jgi:3(or 17)beta-hydroxysteroid dehydrogenase